MITYLSSHEGNSVYPLNISYQATEHRQSTTAQKHRGQKDQHTQVAAHGGGGGERQLRGGGRSISQTCAT